jgi:hypothetical protein
MEEVVKMLSGETKPVMARATLEFFRFLEEKLGRLDKKPANMHQIFQKLR